MSSHRATIDAAARTSLPPIDNRTVVVEHEPAALVPIVERDQIAAQPFGRLGGQHGGDVAVRRGERRNSLQVVPEAP